MQVRRLSLTYNTLTLPVPLNLCIRTKLLFTGLYTLAAVVMQSHSHYSESRDIHGELHRNRPPWSFSLTDVLADLQVHWRSK
jgi:hypothetical protein